MKNPIGKLLWHKAVRKSATYCAAPYNDGLVVIEIPVELYGSVWSPLLKELIKIRIAEAIHKHLIDSATSPKPDGYDANISINFTTTTVLCMINTSRFQDWQWISTAHRFRGGEMSNIIKYE